MKHGHTHRSPDGIITVSPTYHTWIGMRKRCRKNTKGYEHLDYHRDWDDFNTFLADMGERPEGTTLDREDNSKGYYPDNCRWATKKTQARNRKSNKYLTIRGKTMSYAEWAEYLGIPYKRFYNVFIRGDICQG